VAAKNYKAKTLVEKKLRKDFCTKNVDEIDTNFCHSLRTPNIIQKGYYYLSGRNNQMSSAVVKS